LRILVPVDPFLPVPPRLYGGIERVVAALVAELRHRGHEIGLVAHPDSTAAVDYFLPWPRIAPDRLSAEFENARALLRAAAEFRPSLIHSFARLLYLVPWLPRRMPKIMSYQRPTGSWRNRVAAMAAGTSLAFTGCSEFVAALGRRHGGTWHAIPNFVDTGRFRFAPRVAPDAPLLFLSRIESIKGAHIAIEVARRAGRRLVVAGNHAQSGPEREYWERRIEPQLGADGIDYVGEVDDAQKIELLGRAAALIVPIQWDEPFGIVFAEALACGTPVIASPRGALPEIVRDGVEGYLVSDLDAACRAVAEIGRIDRALCRRRAVDKFSTEAVVPQYEALYAAMGRDG